VTSPRVHFGTSIAVLRKLGAGPLQHARGGTSGIDTFVRDGLVIRHHRPRWWYEITPRGRAVLARDEAERAGRIPYSTDWLHNPDGRCRYCGETHGTGNDQYDFHWLDGPGGQPAT
jgi:hypothetical protein